LSQHVKTQRLRITERAAVLAEGTAAEWEKWKGLEFKDFHRCDSGH